MNKKEIKDLLLEKLNELLMLQNFKLFKNKGKFLQIFDGGAFIIDLYLIDSYNLDSDKPIWKIESNLYIRYDVVHDWFLPFENRKKSDLKFNWTYGEKVNETEKFEINRFDITPNLDLKIKNCVNSIYTKFQSFKAKYSSLNSLLETRIKNEGSINFRTVIENLTMLWLLDMGNFKKNEEIYKIKLRELEKVGDPMVREYMPKYEEIITALKVNNFSDSPCRIPNQSGKK